MLGQQKVYEIMKEALSYSGADETELVMMGHDHFLTRYANSQIHQNTVEENTILYIKVVLDNKIGTSSINSFESEDLIRAVESAKEAARFQEKLEDYKGLPQKKKLSNFSAYEPRTAEMVAEEKALVIQDMISRAQVGRMTLSGAFYTGSSELAVMNTNGVREYFRETRANLSVVASGVKTSGYASASSRNVDDINHISLIEEALESAQEREKTIELDSGEYPVVLEEYAVADLILLFSFFSFSADAVAEGRSFVDPHKGQQLFSKNINIYDDALEPGTFRMPFDYEGVPKTRLDFIKGGTVTGQVAYNNYLAGKENRDSTGHGLPPTAGLTRAFPLHIFMGAGEDKKEDLLKKMGTGLLVKRFHYLTPVHPLKTIISGMTRDGVFQVENGKIKARVKNMRFTQSVIDALKNTKGISRERKLIWMRDFSVDMPICAMVPRIYIDKFNFTGNTEF